jgi:UDP-N-acetylmuramoylalanine--D-glutamate ligase
VTVSRPGSEFSGQRVTVAGLGRFGGGVGAVQFLARRGARVTVTDLATEVELSESLARLDGFPVERLVLGRHEPRDFESADLIVVSPGVPRDSPFLEIARRAGVPLSSEMNLFWQFNRGRTIGVTGSSGKSTTAALLHTLLQSAGVRSRLGGNIGMSLLPVVDEIEAGEWVVLELSSFQLEDLDRLKVSPEIAVVTNFAPNHLDRHGTLAAYRQAKQTILRWQALVDTAVLNRDDPDVSRWPVHGRVLWFGSGREAPDAGESVLLDGGTAVVRLAGRVVEVALGDCVRVPGHHNRINALAAIAAAAAVGVDPAATRAGLQSFGGLPHRLEFVAEVAGRRFYNDSKATTPEAARVALEAFEAPIVLLAGGYDKQVDLGPLVEAIRRGTKAVALLGQTAPALRNQLAAGTAGRTIAASVCARFEEAFEWAWRNSAPGDVVLLSPGCASYDWFRDYAARGERFVQLVRELADQAAAVSEPVEACRPGW